MLEAMLISPIPTAGTVCGIVAASGFQRNVTQTESAAKSFVYEMPLSPAARLDLVAQSIETRLSPADLEAANTAVEAILAAEFGDLGKPE